ELRARLAEADVRQADIVHSLEHAVDRREVAEELQRLLDGHVQHVGDRFAAVVDLERLGIVAPAVADLAGDVNVGQEVHLDALDALALAGFAAAALDVEAEAPRLVAADLGFARLGEDPADLVEDTRIRRRV